MQELSHAELWEKVRSLGPIVKECREDCDTLRRLPDAIADAFSRLDFYRLMLPKDFGGLGVDPLTIFDLVEEIATYDGSVGWNFAIGTSGGSLAGFISPDLAHSLFKDLRQPIAGSGAPQGRALAVEGGYRISGRFAWASGIHHAAWVLGGCFVFDGEDRRTGENGAPVVIHALLAKGEITVLDNWHVGGMRGTGSTEFEVDDVFLPNERAVSLFGSTPRHPDPLFRLPPTFFGYALSAVPLGVARHCIESLKSLAHRKRLPPPRTSLVDQQFTQYAVAKAEAMTAAARLGIRDAFTRMWRDVCEDGHATMENRARLRRATVHATETAVEAVQLCCRAAGGTALFEAEPFERSLRDVNAVAGHAVFQRTMMEDAGRVELGLTPLLGMF